METYCPVCLETPNPPDTFCEVCAKARDIVWDGLDEQAKQVVADDPEIAVQVGELIEWIFADLLRRKDFAETLMGLDEIDRNLCMLDAWSSLVIASQRGPTPELVIQEFLLTLVSLPFMTPWYSMGTASRKMVVRTWVGLVRQKSSGGST